MSNHTRDWTEDEERILQERYPDEGAAVVSRLTGRSEEAVRRRAYQFGLKLTPRMRSVVSGRPALESEYAATRDEIGSALGVSRKRVYEIELGALAKLRRAAELVGLGPEDVDHWSRLERM